MNVDAWPLSLLPRSAAAYLRYGAAPSLPPGSRLRAAESDVAALRRLAREDLDLQGQPGAMARAAACAVWPGLVLARALSNVRRHGAAVQRTAGVSRLRQLGQVLNLAWRHDLAPNSYYDFRLFEPEKRALVDRFIQHHELRALLRRLNADVDLSWLDDKRTFNAHCLAHDLPVPRILAVSAHGDLLWNTPEERLPRRDLIVKPYLMFGGTGLERWLYEPTKQAWLRKGEQVTEHQLLDRARERGRTQPLLIQERVMPHTALLDLSPEGTLCTARVVTWRAPLDPEGSAESGVLEAFLRMPAKAGMEVDNWAQGGIGALIDLSRSVLGCAYRGPERMEVHPATGARILDHPVPFAAQLEPLCLRAHASLPAGFWFVGWDVGFGIDGLVLIEANSIWGCPEWPPLGSTEFPRLARRKLSAR